MGGLDLDEEILGDLAGLFLAARFWSIPHLFDLIPAHVFIYIYIWTVTPSHSPNFWQAKRESKTELWRKKLDYQTLVLVNRKSSFTYEETRDCNMLLFLLLLLVLNIMSVNAHVPILYISVYIYKYKYIYIYVCLNFQNNFVQYQIMVNTVGMTWPPRTTQFFHPTCLTPKRTCSLWKSLQWESG